MSLNFCLARLIDRFMIPKMCGSITGKTVCSWISHHAFYASLYYVCMNIFFCCFVRSLCADIPTSSASFKSPRTAGSFLTAHADCPRLYRARLIFARPGINISSFVGLDLFSYWCAVSFPHFLSRTVTPGNGFARGFGRVVWGMISNNMTTLGFGAGDTLSS